MTSIPEKLDKALIDCCNQLNECASAISEMKADSKREDIQKIGRAMAELLELRSNLYRSHPNLKPEDWDDPPSEDDYEIMYQNALKIADEYLEAGKVEQAIDTLESFILIKPIEKYELMASNRINEIRNQNAL